MRTLLITGGAGFIGSNLVHYALDHTADRVVVVDKLTYAGSLLNLEGPLAGSPRGVRAGRHRRPRRDGARLRRAPARRRRSIWPPRRTSIARSTVPAPFIDTNIVGTFVLLETARQFVAALGPPARERVPVPARLDRRGVRHARPERAVQRGDAVRAELAVRGEQGVGRSPGARLLPHLRAAGRSSRTARTTTGRFSFPRS